MNKENTIYQQIEELEKQAQQYREQIRDLKIELAVNARMLAQQTDAARVAEMRAMKAERELADAQWLRVTIKNLRKGS